MNTKRQSEVHSSIGPREVRPVRMTANDVHNFYELARIGIHLDQKVVGQMMDGLGFDGNGEILLGHYVYEHRC